jgi:hypothetical protein
MYPQEKGGPPHSGGCEIVMQWKTAIRSLPYEVKSIEIVLFLRLHDFSTKIKLKPISLREERKIMQQEVDTTLSHCNLGGGGHFTDEEN